MASVFGNPDSTPKEEGGVEWSTDCVIHNATGHTISFICRKEWSRQASERGPYPSEIQNDQVVSVLNVKDTIGSTAGVVYRGEYGKEGKYCDHMMAWSNPWSTDPAEQNSVWTETREVDHYTDTEWEPIIELTVPRTNHTDTWKDCVSAITITDEISATVRAKFTSNADDDDA